MLQEELEDANAHQKRYYEALMSKEQQLREMRASCAALQTAVQSAPCYLVITPCRTLQYCSLLAPTPTPTLTPTLTPQPSLLNPHF